MCLLVSSWGLLGMNDARAGNTDDAVAGTDAALTAGAVVAIVRTGAALWFNPAGVAMLDMRSVGLTGSLYSISILKAPGLMSLENGEETRENQLSLGAVPRALTFALALSPKLRLGFGFFYSRSRSRLVQDSVRSENASSAVEWFTSDGRSFSSYHVSAAVGWKFSERLYLGAALDIVLSQFEQFSLLSGAYDGGEAGAATTDLASSIAGGGLQLKAGVQWTPSDVVRTGLSVSMPSYMVYISEDTTRTQLVAPPDGPGRFEGTQLSDLSGAWTGSEPGNIRAGVAYVKSWGWLELDLIYDFPLESADFNIHRKGIFNARLGGSSERRGRLIWGLASSRTVARKRAWRPLATETSTFMARISGWTSRTGKSHPAPMKRASTSLSPLPCVTSMGTAGSPECSFRRTSPRKTSCSTP